MALHRTNVRTPTPAPAIAAWIAGRKAPRLLSSHPRGANRIAKTTKLGCEGRRSRCVLLKVKPTLSTCLFHPTRRRRLVTPSVTQKKPHAISSTCSRLTGYNMRGRQYPKNASRPQASHADAPAPHAAHAVLLSLSHTSLATERKVRFALAAARTRTRAPSNGAAQPQQQPQQRASRFARSGARAAQVTLGCFHSGGGADPWPKDNWYGAEANIDGWFGTVAEALAKQPI